MKKLLCILLSLTLLAGCAAAPAETTAPGHAGEVLIRLSDEGVEFPADSGVSVANDILYYEAGHGEDYGEGKAWEAHTAEEAALHTVVHITKPGTYRLTGTLSAGQIAVDLGKDAKTDPTAMVTLILDGVDITCTVAPAVIFYNVYESGNTSGAGAGVILADGSRNYIHGSHVAEIYAPGTEERLHKYDAAFYSRMSMNMGGTGMLCIEADNEGLGTEMHLTIDGGEIYIASGNDGINTNADGVSVITVNGGRLWIAVSGTTGEGDGIDSNGSVVINGGHVESYACSTSGDSGIDADMGVRINGGTVIATGNMLDPIDENGQTYAVFTFSLPQQPGTYTLKDAAGTTVVELNAQNVFQTLILSAPQLAEGAYTLWCGDTQFQGAAIRGGLIGQIQRPEWPGDDRGGGDVEIPPQPTVPVEIQGANPPADNRPEDMPLGQPSQGYDPGRMPIGEPPEGSDPSRMPVGQLPGGVTPPQGGFTGGGSVALIELASEFHLTRGANYFISVQPAAEN